jgi:hypothetical protein
LHAVDECRVEEDAAPFHEILNFKHFLVDGWICCGQSVEGRAEISTCAPDPVGVALGLGKSEIRDRRRRPRRLDQPGRLGEEGGREPGERIAFSVRSKRSSSSAS